jgi:hypothetical protein
MVANFGGVDYKQDTVAVPQRSILARWRDTGATKLYSLKP